MEALCHQGIVSPYVLPNPSCSTSRPNQQLPPVTASLPARSLVGRNGLRGSPLEAKSVCQLSLSRRQSKAVSIRSALVTEPTSTAVEEAARTATGGTKIEEVAPGVWTFTQSLGVAALGLDPLLRMTAIKLPNGDVWLHSPVALNADVASRLAALGPVGHIVISNTSPEHGFFARAYAKAYPDARIYATVPLQQLSIAVRWGLPRVDEVLADEAPAAWAGVIDQVIFNFPTNPKPPVEGLFCHRPSGILLASDTMLYADDRSAKFAFNRSNFKMAGMWEQVGGLLAFLAKDEKRRALMPNVVDALVSWPYDTLVFSHLSAPVPNGKELVCRGLGVAPPKNE